MHESLIDLYRVFCQPTAFLAKARGLGLWRRLVFMLRIAPAVLAVNVLTTGIVSLAAEALGMRVRWLSDGFGMCAASLGLGIAWGIVWNVAMGVAWGVVWGPVAWVLGNVVLPFVPLVPQGVTQAIAVWAPLGFALGVGLGVTVGTARGALSGLALGVLVGVLWRVPATAAWTVSFLVGYFRLEWYAVDVGATVWQLLVARSSPRQARGLLRASPIYWREPIWLPLLGCKPLLCLVAEQDFQAGVEECLFVISRRPTQARMARGALMEILARHLAAVGSVREIAAVGEELGRAAAAGIRLPALLEEALSGLAQLARHGEQHLSVFLPHNRRRALERLREGADDLARKLALNPGGLARMLMEVASKWRQVAEARLEEMGQQEAAAGFIPNPFVFGQPIEETETNLFVGRRDTVREIEVSLLSGEQKPALVLWGPRRMGKTSVLLQLPRLLGAEFVPAFVDMQAMQVRESVGSFFKSLTEAAAQALRRRGMEAKGLSLAELGTNPFSQFADWVQEVEGHLGGERRLLLCLDEFERLETSIQEGRLPAALMDEIRHLVQHHPRIVLLFAGSHRPDEMHLNWPDVLINTKMIRVSYLAAEEARQLITQPVPDFGVSYGPGSVEGIVKLTRCQPYLVQAVCYELVNHLNVEGRREASSEDVEVSVGRALESAHLYFAEMWRQLSGCQQGLLRRIAQSADGADSEVLGRAVGATPAQLDHDLKRLEARSVIAQDDQRWRFEVPMVASWVRAQSY